MPHQNFQTSRGRSRGRGGSRGTGGLRHGRGRPIFDSARIAQKEEVSDEESESVSSTEEETDLDGQSESSQDESNDLLPGQSYAALMQSLSAPSVPRVKRRKLNHDQEEAQSHDGQSSEGIEPQLEDEGVIEEVDEGPETSIDDVLGDEVEEDASDPFMTHFSNPDESNITAALNSIKQEEWTIQRDSLPDIGMSFISLPSGTATGINTRKSPIAGPEVLSLKAQLSRNIKKNHPSFNVLERHIAPVVFDYQDLLYCERNPKVAASLRRLACLHTVNHVFKTRDRVIKNNARLAKEDNSDLDLRDQGFTRPKVLVLLPTRQSCVRMVNTIVSICEPDQQENRKRFDDSYLRKPDETSATKPDDFKELFEGNDDDMFRLGLKFTRKTIKYFSQFYSSDLILASPLGLRTAIMNEKDKKVDYDFLSSIEMVIVDQADALLMQNWDHVEHIFEHLNLQLKEAHGCDFSRVRSWYLDNNAEFFRQTIALTAFNTPELNNLFYNNSKNWAGKVKIKGTYKGAIQELPLKVRQTFSRLEITPGSTDPDARFAYFTSAIIPALTRRSKTTNGVLLFIPSYFDFVRVRDYFSTSATTSNLSFGCISEYNSMKEVARARSHFLTGRHSVLLYTERAHHFNRFRIRGVKSVIMYGLPEHPIFYREIAGEYLDKSIQERKLERGQGSARILFSRMDLLKLERVVGTERVSKMLSEKGDTFDFS